MQDTILIQTDFREESLILIKTAIQNNPGTKLNIVLVHGIELTDSITELLFFSKHKILEKVSNPAFQKGLDEIKSLFAASINSLRVELFTGFNQAAFNNFLEANNVTQIFLSNGYTFKSSYKQSRDLSGYINKSVQKKVEISLSSASQSFNHFAMSR